MVIDEVDRKIISRLQSGIAVEEEPFRSVALELEIDEGELLRRLQGLVDRGVLSRFGPLLNAQALGGGVTLAAMSVPEDRFEEVTEIVNSYPEVGHNYERDHHWNMWFVLLTEDPEQIGRVQRLIEKRTALEVRLFPKEKEYYLNFQLQL